MTKPYCWLSEEDNEVISNGKVELCLKVNEDATKGLIPLFTAAALEAVREETIEECAEVADHLLEHDGNVAYRIAKEIRALVHSDEKETK